eukprot:5497769-Ditylum_brightwellii.AAC.1
MANSYLSVQNFYKPGGVMSISQDDIAGRKIMEGMQIKQQNRDYGVSPTSCNAQAAKQNRTSKESIYYRSS